MLAQHRTDSTVVGTPKHTSQAGFLLPVTNLKGLVTRSSSDIAAALTRVRGPKMGGNAMPNGWRLLRDILNERAWLKDVVPMWSGSSGRVRTFFRRELSGPEWIGAWELRQKRTVPRSGALSRVPCTFHEATPFSNHVTTTDKTVHAEAEQTDKMNPRLSSGAMRTFTGLRMFQPTRVMMRPVPVS